MDILNKIESDYKVEMIATQLLIENLDFSKIIVDRLSNASRTYTKDVYRSYEDVSQHSMDKYTIFESHRQSIYETLPENVFHPPTLGGLGKPQEEIVEEIKKQRNKEAEARIFFKPFEQEGPYLEMFALMLELMYEKKGTYNNLYCLFEQGWPVLRKLPYHTALSFIYILPILNEVRGDRTWTEKCLSYLTDFPIEIRESYGHDPIDRKMEGFVLREAHLGIDSTFLGNQNDGLPSWDIYIGPVPKDLIVSVLPQSYFEELLDIFEEHFIPTNIFVRYFIQSEPLSETFLSADTSSGRLGYTFYL